MEGKKRIWQGLRWVKGFHILFPSDQFGLDFVVRLVYQNHSDDGDETDRQVNVEAKTPRNSVLLHGLEWEQ